jgi:hypothetical protein
MERQAAVAAGPLEQGVTPEVAVAGVEQMVAEAVKRCDLPGDPPVVAAAPLEQELAPEWVKQCDLPGHPPVVAGPPLEQELASEVVKQCDLPGHPPVVAALQQVRTTESPAVVFLQVRIREQPGVVSVLFLPVTMTQRNPTALGTPV